MNENIIDEGKAKEILEEILKFEHSLQANKKNFHHQKAIIEILQDKLGLRTSLNLTERNGR